jgi:hypothetical protein
VKVVNVASGSSIAASSAAHPEGAGGGRVPPGAAIAAEVMAYVPLAPSSCMLVSHLLRLASLDPSTRPITVRRTGAMPAASGDGRHGEAGPRDLLEKSLEQRRHVAKPQGKEDDKVVCPGQRLLRLHERFGHGRGFPLPLAFEKREVETRDVERSHFA